MTIILMNYILPQNLPAHLRWKDQLDDPLFMSKGNLLSTERAFYAGGTSIPLCAGDEAAEMCR
jgi:hypothetical protein